MSELPVQWHPCHAWSTETSDHRAFPGPEVALTDFPVLAKGLPDPLSVGDKPASQSRLPKTLSPFPALYADKSAFLIHSLWYPGIPFAP